MDKPFVLLADDNEATCTLIKAVLGPEFHVDAVSDGAEAIDRLRAHHYSAILLDLLMPGSDGFAVLDFLTAERPESLSGVLVLTAALSRREMSRLAGYPVCAVIPKPFEVESLREQVRRCCDASDPRGGRGPFITSGMILLLAQLVREKWIG